MPSLEALPVEIRLQILSYLNPDKLNQLRVLSKGFDRMIKDPSAWRQCFLVSSEARKVKYLEGPILFLLYWKDLKERYRSFHPFHIALKVLFQAVEEEPEEKDKAERLFFTICAADAENKANFIRAVALYAPTLNKLLLTHYWGSWCEMLSQLLSQKPELLSRLLNNTDLLEALSKRASAVEIYSLIKHTEENVCLIFKNMKLQAIKEKLLRNVGVDFFKEKTWAFRLALQYSKFAQFALTEKAFIQSLNYISLQSITKQHPELFSLFNNKCFVEQGSAYPGDYCLLIFTSTSESVKKKSLEKEFRTLKKRNKTINTWLVENHCSVFNQFLLRTLPHLEGSSYDLRYSQKDATQVSVSVLSVELKPLDLTYQAQLRYSRLIDKKQLSFSSFSLPPVLKKAIKQKNKPIALPPTRRLTFSV